MIPQLAEGVLGMDEVPSSILGHGSGGMMLDKIKKYLSCSKCHGTGIQKVEERIPRSELSPSDQAELMVNGGYAYRIVEKPCLH